MSEPVIHGPEKANETKPVRSFGRTVLGLVILAAFAAAWFSLAGRWTWVPGWAFLSAFTIYSTALALWLARSNPALFAERNRRADNVESWDKWVVRCYNVLFLALLVVAALDSGRFRWSAVPFAVQVTAWALLGLAAAAIWHLMAVNTYLSSMVRIQDDRDHVVVTAGLYRFVRHPMYVAILLSAFCVPLALASLWALIPGALIAVVIVYRTAREDLTLMEKLAGYEAYASRVRHRLLPGLW